LGLEVVEDLRDVLVDGSVLDQSEVAGLRIGLGKCSPVSLEVTLGHVGLITLECVLDLCRGLPLVAPDDVKPGTVESKMETADACKELGNSGSATGLTLGRGIILGHVVPFATGRVRSLG
jgi:hypothetical protein